MSVEPRVNFVVAGAQKAGTSALRHYLLQHPQIGLSRPPETHFFSRLYKQEPAGNLYQGYHDLFDDVALAARMTGDVTPIYIWMNGCLERIQAYNPAMKIIIILRDPVARAYSQWAMEYERGTEKLVFSRALLEEIRETPLGRQDPVRSYLSRGFYSKQIRRLFGLFPRDQCLILCHEDLRHAHADTLHRVHEFLGVDAVPAPPPATVHARQYPPLSLGMRLVLQQAYARDMRRLKRLLGWKCHKGRGA